MRVVLYGGRYDSAANVIVTGGMPRGCGKVGRSATQGFCTFNDVRKKRKCSHRRAQEVCTAVKVGQ